MDHVILNHGQVTWMTPELAPPLLTTTPHQQEDVSALDRFSVHRCPTRQVAAIRDIFRSCLDPNDFTVLNCIVKGHASLSPPSLRLRLCSRFTLLAT
ncbi:uncharacterized protein TNCV_643841 [Trichonephila clavipes]|nr:uncharacterized protein TNCV_643841 [Trichonephila clavipes]